MIKDKMNPCRKCGGEAHVVMYSGCPYAQCTKCTKWDPYQFLGANVAGAIHEWNLYNN